MLPLLARPEYYRDLCYGYACGHEPVRYAQRVREYHDILNAAVKPPMAACDWGLMPALAEGGGRR